MRGVRVYGATSNLLDVGYLGLSSGRFFLRHEVERARHVCGIGWDLKQKFFPQLEGLGRVVRVEGIPLQVMGVLAQRGSRFGWSLDKTLYMPLPTYGKLTAERPSLLIRGRAGSRESLEPALDQVRAAMRLRHRLKPNEADDFHRRKVCVLGKGVAVALFGPQSSVLGRTVRLGGGRGRATPLPWSVCLKQERRP